MNKVLSIANVSKEFDKKKVLNGINLSIKTSSVFCLLGKNGAGKTTLIKGILDYFQLSSGKIELFNQAHNKLNVHAKQQIGAQIEELTLIEELNARLYLRLVCNLYRVPISESEKRIHSLLNYFFDEGEDLDGIIRDFSTGMKKKLSFCASVIHRPTILILDEPFSNLDPISCDLMVNFLSNYKNQDRIIFISSHDLNYVEKISTHIGVIDNGNMLFNGTLKDFTENGLNTLSDSLVNLLSPNSKDINKLNWL